jgi:hypothetical protein
MIVLLVDSQLSIQSPKLRVLDTNLVYHEQSLRVIIQKNPKHPWRCLPIFTNDELLGHLNSIVTTEPTKRVPEKLTGLARNTTLLKHVREMKEIF